MAGKIENLIKGPHKYCTRLKSWTIHLLYGVIAKNSIEGFFSPHLEKVDWDLNVPYEQRREQFLRN